MYQRKGRQYLGYCFCSLPSERRAGRFKVAFDHLRFWADMMLSEARKVGSKSKRKQLQSSLQFRLSSSAIQPPYTLCDYFFRFQPGKPSSRCKLDEFQCRLLFLVLSSFIVILLFVFLSLSFFTTLNIIQGDC